MSFGYNLDYNLLGVLERAARRETRRTREQKCFSREDMCTPSANPVIFEGWLSKYSTSGGLTGNWRKRYIVFRQTRVSWFKSDDVDQQPNGMMSLDDPKLAVVPGKKLTQLTIVAEKKLFVEGSAEQISQLSAALEGLIVSRGAGGSGSGAALDATAMADMLFANSCRRDTMDAVDNNPFSNPPTREAASSSVVSAHGNPFGD